MHEYLFDVEIVRVAVILGVVVSMLFYERLQLTTGGAIVPGYLAVFLPRPLFIVTTLVTASLSYLIVNRVIARRTILYGRRKFEMEILVTLTLVMLWVGGAHLVMHLHPLLIALYGIGFIIPAIIAHDMARQGPAQTIATVATTTLLVGLLVYVFYSLLVTAPGYRPSPPVEFLDGELAYPRDLLLPGVFTSVLTGMLAFRYLGIRTGGFVMGAYIALVLSRPLDLVFALAVAGATYLVVVRVLQRHMLLFGRRKLATVVLVAAVLAWAGELLLVWGSQGAYHPWRGFHAITLFVPALLANDAERQGFYPTLWGAAISAAAVFAGMNLLDAARHALAA